MRGVRQGSYVKPRCAAEGKLQSAGAPRPAPAAPRARRLAWTAHGLRVSVRRRAGRCARLRQCLQIVQRPFPQPTNTSTRAGSAAPEAAQETHPACTGRHPGNPQSWSCRCPRAKHAHALQPTWEWPSRQLAGDPSCNRRQIAAPLWTLRNLLQRILSLFGVSEPVLGPCWPRSAPACACSGISSSTDGCEGSVWHGKVTGRGRCPGTCM